MARDIRSTTKNVSKRCKYFKTTLENNKFTIINIDEYGIFYAYVNKPIIKNAINGDNFRTKNSTLELVTNDNVKDLDVDYVVLFEGDYWRVENFTTQQISIIGSRPVYETVISLVK